MRLTSDYTSRQWLFATIHMAQPSTPDTCLGLCIGTLGLAFHGKVWLADALRGAGHTHLQQHAMNNSSRLKASPVMTPGLSTKRTVLPTEPCCGCSTVPCLRLACCIALLCSITAVAVSKDAGLACVASGTLRPLAAVDLISSRRGLSTSRSRSCIQSGEVMPQGRLARASKCTNAERGIQGMQHAHQQCTWTCSPARCRPREAAPAQCTPPASNRTDPHEH